MPSKILPCPRCKQPVRWDENAQWKPFCSERCRLIDLGAWFAEEHVIPGPPVDPDPGADQGDENT